MQFQGDTYRAIELLRFLRRATPETPWSAEELAIAIAVEDYEITSRLALLYHLEESEEDSTRIHSAIKEILRERKKQGKAIPSIDAVRRTLNELANKRWITTKRGKGSWLTKEGNQVPILEILHAFGEDVGTAVCCRERDQFSCPYREACRAYKFHEQLSTMLRKILCNVTIEDIALGTWPKYVQEQEKALV